MIPELGQFALIIALCFALVQATLPFYGAQKNLTSFMQLARYTAWGQFIFVAFSFGVLAYSFIVNDFSVAYVAQNSNTELPAIFRFCAVWGAHEGSLLLWVLILTLWTMLVATFSRSLPLYMVARVLGVLGIIAIGFYLFILLTSDPFTRLLPYIPANGHNLNPILQDPGMVGHPPILYMGYVGFSVAFAFAIAALINGKLDATWARWTRPWTLAAWCFLTCGIVLGSWWSYRELGWGGWWFWDPVENASFMPWLAGTALIHCLITTEKRGVFKAWTVLLAVTTFALSLLGTFLVRSGVLISVHAFAEDPTRGQYLLEFLAVVVGGSLLLYAIRGRKIVAPTGQFSALSRESFLLLNNIILFVAMLVVLLGTLYPLFYAEMGYGQLSVGYPYFNATFVPLMMPLLFLMAIGPMLHWGKMALNKLSLRLGILFILVLIAAWLLPLAYKVPMHFSVVLGLFLALWVICGMVVNYFNKTFTWSRLGMTLAHIGLAVSVIGMVLVSFYGQDKNLSLAVGQSTKIQDYRVQFAQVYNIKGSDYHGVQADMLLYHNGELLNVLHPQLRMYNVQKIETSKVAIDVGVFRDIYVALGAPIGTHSWSVRIYYKPFVRWMWIGGLMMALGGVLALFGIRRKVVLTSKRLNVGGSI